MSNETTTVKDVNSAFTQLQKRLAPAALANIPENGLRVRNYCDRHQLSVLNIDDLLTAVVELDKTYALAWIVPPAQGALESLIAPKQMTQSEQQKALRERAERLAAKDLADQIRADADNHKDPRERAAEVKQREEAAKAVDAGKNEQEQARVQLGQKILTWTVNRGPGQTDFSASEQGQKLLKEVRVNGADGKVDWVATRRVVLSAFNTDSVSQLRQALAIELSRLNEQPVVNQKALDARRGAGMGNIHNYSRWGDT